MKIDAIRRFMRRFDFRKEFEGYIGIERERFLVDKDGMPIPQADLFLTAAGDKRFAHELSRCQIEDRTEPHRDIMRLKLNLFENDSLVYKTTSEIGSGAAMYEVASATMPLEVYPTPRYENIVKRITREQLIAACRVAGVHIHIGVRDMNEALVVYGILREKLSELSHLGDHSSGERLTLYKTMATKWEPPTYANVEDFYEVARIHGFDDSPRNCWHLIRISVHGTVECRMFGATDQADEIINWVELIQSHIHV
ncbi:hypothetical protein HY967_02350 [Candidatus Jorgensenbacteria bacterium]|nr:hypothetical protein [Candidatus Jorgensenbacteria bacterium]